MASTSTVYTPPKRKLEISFGGCGFLGVYHIGVGKCVVDHAPHLFDEFSGFYGASAGAITAVWAACKSDPMVPYKWVKKTYEASREHRLLGVLHPSFDLYARLRDFLEEFLPADAHKLTRKTVEISLTTFPERKNWLVSNFTTRKELINAIIASSFIPGYAGMKNLPKFRGKRCCDGGFTSNVPKCHDPNVITVSPFGGECDICPQDESHSPYLIHVHGQSIQMSARNISRLLKALIPTSWSELEELFYSGYKDAYRFFKLEGIISESVIRPVKRRSQAVLELSSGVTAKDVQKEPQRTKDDPTKDNTSDYFSQCSETVSLRSHHRRISVTVSTNGDFFSCFDADEERRETEAAAAAMTTEDKREAGKVAKIPTSFLNSLKLEIEKLVKELEAAKGREAELREKASMWMRLLEMCSPTHLPLLGSIASYHGDHTKDTDDSWFANHPELLQSITSSWSNCMAVM